MRISDWSSDVCSSDLDFVNEHTSALGSSLRGRAAYGERLPRFLEEFRGLRYEVEDLIVSGERAAVPYTMSFTWTAPDGTALPVAISGMFRLRVVDGRIAHRVDYWDGTDFQRQTSGATAAPRSEERRVGKEGESECRCRALPGRLKKKKQIKSQTHQKYDK